MSNKTNSSYTSSGENDPYIAAGNIVNEILLAHKDKWAGDDEIQDMLAEAFVKGVKYQLETNSAVPTPKYESRGDKEV